MFGYVGRIARVDLTSRSVKVEKVPGWLIELFIGGKGFVYGLLSRELTPGVDAFSPGNKIVIAAAPWLVWLLRLLRLLLVLLVH